MTYFAPLYIIYKIHNTINGKIYIGMTKHSLKKRLSQHCVNKSCIGEALRKYGKDNFVSEVIDRADDWMSLSDKEKLISESLIASRPTDITLRTVVMVL